MAQRVPNPAITDSLRDEMIDFYTDLCVKLERERHATNPKLSPEECSAILVSCVRDADDATLAQYGYRIRDLFVTAEQIAAEPTA